MTLKLPPTASSSSYEDASSSSEEEETDYESDTEAVTDSKLVQASSKPKTTAADSSGGKVVVPENSSSSEEEETDSESETDPVADSKIVETSSKPKTTGYSFSQVEPPADSNNVETSNKPVSKKRSIDEKDEGEAKRVKRVSGGVDDKKSTGQETKKNYFQRVWTEGDEITILQGIIDYQNETGSSPFDDKNALYELLKNSVSINPSKTQFLEKIRGLKKKYESNLGKEKKKGEELVFPKPHDLEAFRLSKFVWGEESIMATPIEVKPPMLKLVEPESISTVESVVRFGVDGRLAKKGWIRLSTEDKKRFEEESEALQLEELKINSRKSRFIHDVTTTMAEALQQDH